jgi:hypothetical protein
MSYIPGTTFEFGKEDCPAACKARIVWEREQSKALSYDDILSAMHERTAKAYEELYADMCRKER